MPVVVAAVFYNACLPHSGTPKFLDFTQGLTRFVSGE
jgi:hypothetical protein